MIDRLLPAWLTYRPSRGAYTSISLATVLALAPTISQAFSFDLEVRDQNGAPVGAYRWLVEEDISIPNTPGVPNAESLAFKIHKSGSIVVASGASGSFSTAITVPDGAGYFLSVLPAYGPGPEFEPTHTIGGTTVEDGQALVRVTVQTTPLPTAQISIVVFHDNNPVNNMRDAGEEGLPGWTVVLNEAAGQVQVDAFDNKLGTTYNADGTVNTFGTGNLLTGPCPGSDCGRLLVKNLAQGKYGVVLVPPAGGGWTQTSTLEGGQEQDGWLKPNEPPVFLEAGGPADAHVIVGFVQPFNLLGPGGVTPVQIEAKTVHYSRPPVVTFNQGLTLDGLTSSGWAALNTIGVGGEGVFAAPFDTASEITIPSVPPGDYQLVVWDTALALIIGQAKLTVNPDGTCLPVSSCDFSGADAVTVFPWYGRSEHFVFTDLDGDGFPDPGETDLIQEQNVNLRNRDGTVYQAFPTDGTGFVPFDEKFPYFAWQIAEIDYARFEATGVTIVTDAGGPIPPHTGWTGVPSHDMANPQVQCDPDTDPASPTFGVCTPIINPHTGNALSRTHCCGTGTLLQAFQSFQGLNNIYWWGKRPWGPGENGGIAGVVAYAVTRAEDDPRFTATEEWEPGIARVQIALYQDSDGDGVIDDVNGGDSNLSGVAWDLADVDNYPFGWMDGSGAMGTEDTDHNGNGVFEYGDAINVGTTDSWNDNMPTDCPSDPTAQLGGIAEGTQNPFVTQGGVAQDCFDGLATFGQVRPGVFDGGWAIESYFPGGGDSANPEVDGLPAGTYIVESVPPPGYETVKEEDKNVDFGDSYEPDPDPLLLPPICVGDGHVVPEFLTLFGAIPAPYQFETRPLCDRKQITLNNGQNADVPMAMKTDTPKAAYLYGRINDDTQPEFNDGSPNNQEKYGPPWLPVSIEDYEGNEIIRTHADEFGYYNTMVPSTYTVNAPAPSGVSPQMWRVCINDRGAPNPDFGQPGEPPFIDDPLYNPAYNKSCYTLDFWPGGTTYGDTPVLRIAALEGPRRFPLDCNAPTNTPEIFSVNGPGGGPIALAGQSVEILSSGTVMVRNPEFSPGGIEPLQIPRDFGFGTMPGAVTVNGTVIIPDSWADDSIVFTVPAGATTGHLTVTLPDGRENSTGSSVTLTIGDPTGATYVSPGESIQAAIDAATSGDLIIIEPGIYNELVILYKDVQLQGSGAKSTIIEAAAENPQLEVWAAQLRALIIANPGFLVPFQNEALALTAFDTGANGIPLESFGILVLTDGTELTPSRIDGVTISGSNQGAAILVNGNSDGLQISNTTVNGNAGRFVGGIRVGHNGHQFAVVDADNDNLTIAHNRIVQNGALFGRAGAGGGIGLYSGSTGYEVSENFICGNFAIGGGGGIGHLGLSDDGTIANNTIIFNESYHGINNEAGGGILLSGDRTETLGLGAGSVTVSHNLLQGNLAGAGDGGGIGVTDFNGADVLLSPGNPSNWHALNIWNNVIVNNVAAVAGGGIALQDAVRASIVNNTIAHNDSSGTGAGAFPAGNVNMSGQHPAGFVARTHGASALNASGKTFSDPDVFANNILFENRAFYAELTGINIELLPAVPAGGYAEATMGWDLGVLPAAAGTLTPTSSYLTVESHTIDGISYAGSGNIFGNNVGAPAFVSSYFLGPRSDISGLTENDVFTAAGTFDEGGNFLSVSYGPLSLFDPATGLLFGDPHITASSPVIGVGSDAAVPTTLMMDIDGEVRIVATVEIGADEWIDSDGAGPIGPLSAGTGDGVPDRIDNCVLAMNTSQVNSDGDFFGDACDGDYNNNGIVDFGDAAAFRGKLGQPDPEGDFNENGVVDFGDAAGFRGMLGQPPGPSGLEP